MKFKIYLNSNKFLKYSFADDNLEIDFFIEDYILIAKEISKIVSYIETLFDVRVDFDEMTRKNIVETTTKISDFEDAYKKLEMLKKSEYMKNESYISFRDFCNKTLKCQLRDYQCSAAYFLTIGQGGFDFSVPGSGKTIITYATYNYLKANNICDYILIIGPINSLNAWYDEYGTCFTISPDFTSLTYMTQKEAEIYLLSSKHNHSEITFVNIDKAWRMKKELINFIGDKKVLLIVDEAHKEKNPEAKITKAVVEITKHVKYRIILTGTPMPNGYEDLYSLLKIYEPYEKILPYNYSDLKRITRNGATEQQQIKIMTAIKPLYSRISKAYLLNMGELLPPNYSFIKCNLSLQQKELYDFLNIMAYDMNDDFESILNLNLMKAILIRKMQVSANPGLLSKSIVDSIEEYKKEYLEEYNEEDSDTDALLKADQIIKKSIAHNPIIKLIHKFESSFYDTPKNLAAVDLAVNLVTKGEKVIIWEIFVQNMYVLKNLIEKRMKCFVEIVNGKVNGKDRQDALYRFKNGNSMVLIANPATLAESVSLHRVCQNAIYVNRNFNAAQFIQSKDRIHRINMPKGKTANYYFLINEDTVDEIVQERLKLKEDRMIKILDSDDLVIGGSELESTSFMSFDDVLSSYKK
ncbi:MAG: DEAD/DEAH box helicase [Malacoplasma sp.]|nr:DEAD/DEAH box helicase [Malacoplasma sp.]